VNKVGFKKFPVISFDPKERDLYYDARTFLIYQAQRREEWKKDTVEKLEKQRKDNDDTIERICGSTKPNIETFGYGHPPIGSAHFFTVSKLIHRNEVISEFLEALK